VSESSICFQRGSKERSSLVSNHIAFTRKGVRKSYNLTNNNSIYTPEMSSDVKELLVARACIKGYKAFPIGLPWESSFKVLKLGWVAMRFTKALINSSPSEPL
jgi:hypothetical protein